MKTPSHLFLLTPGLWLGQGSLSFTLSAEEVKFFTRWKVEKLDNGKISCIQETEVDGSSSVVTNQLSFSHMSASKFLVMLNNDTFGELKGSGVIDDKVIAWEYRGKAQPVEGFEIYEKKNSDRYSVYAEYASDDFYRTTIKGEIWQKIE